MKLDLKFRAAAAFALISWYLVKPPMRCERWNIWRLGSTCLEVDVDTSADLDAPLSKWHIVSPFERLVDCDAERMGAIQELQVAGAKTSPAELQNSIFATESQCIATDDPRLKN
jgi:hypothetical protein